MLTAGKKNIPLTPLPRFLPFAPPLMGQRELKEIAGTLKSGWLTTGPKAERFEAAMAEYLGAPSSLAVSSCTAALHLALLVLNLKPGEGVITTPLTFASTAHAIIYCGARPFLADISPDTGNLDPQKVLEFIENECVTGPDGRPVHRASKVKITTLLPIHYGGHPADLPAFWSLAREYQLNILEDAAHATGTFLGDLPVGHPDLRPPQAPPGMTAFSFYATKNLATGEGGLLTASSPLLLDRARKLSAYGLSDARRIWGRYAPQGTWVYDIEELGYKYNFTDIQASLGLVQLSRLRGMLEARRLRADLWTKILAELDDLVILPRERSGAKPSWHLYPLRVNTERLKISRDELIVRLRELNIGTSVMFIPIHYHSYYQKSLGYVPGSFPEAESFFQKEISLPVSPAASLKNIRSAANLTVNLIKTWAK
ncbi:MAG: DegT/DnrJ/EryC1/StrS family aminotransferase [Deltaproteobacteria bacterium]|jgi:dTDP-4-amino-4,6-dideoxygalactose transaminase|nr:DegT/DnrJ/EryC1/StrS family aminotransferase [Deltaproteobacteria bacterium]